MSVAVPRPPPALVCSIIRVVLNVNSLRLIHSSGLRIF